MASRWRHCVDLTGPGIEPQTSRTDSMRLATELTAGYEFTNQAQFSGRIKNSSIRNLSPIVVKGILRVRGRSERSTIHAERKHPIILPSKHHVTNLVILHAHCSEGHAGPLHTLAAVRERYWVIKGTPLFAGLLDYVVSVG